LCGSWRSKSRRRRLKTSQDGTKFTFKFLSLSNKFKARQTYRRILLALRRMQRAATICHLLHGERVHSLATVSLTDNTCNLQSNDHSNEHTPRAEMVKEAPESLL
jgi:hypothetical protein